MLRVISLLADSTRCLALRKCNFIKGSSRARLGPRLPTHRSMPPRVNLQLRFSRGQCHFFDGVGGAPFAEGLDAFCLGGPAFFGFRTSLPFAMFTSFKLGGRPVERSYGSKLMFCGCPGWRPVGHQDRLAELGAPAPQPTKKCQSKRSNHGGKDRLVTHKVPNRADALPGLAGKLVHNTILPKFWVGGGVAKCLLELTFELGALTRDCIDIHSSTPTMRQGNARCLLRVPSLREEIDSEVPVADCQIGGQYNDRCG